MVVVEDQVHIPDMNRKTVTKNIVGQRVKKNVQLIIISWKKKQIINDKVIILFCLMILLKILILLYCLFLVLDKLGIELKVPSIGNSTLPSTTQVTPQQLLQKSMEAQVEKVKVQTGIELPSYYNPVAVNPNKYAEQIQKRKLLWGNKQNNDVVKPVEESKPAVAVTNKTATIWQSTKFGDQDGKVTAKFKRLMGIKDSEKGKVHSISMHFYTLYKIIYLFLSSRC